MIAKEIITEFIQALNEEITALKKGKGGNIVQVFKGRLTGRSAELWVYRFNVENFLVAIDDMPAEIEIKGQKYKCQIVSIHGLEVDIAIEKNLGEFVPEAKIKMNLWYLLELLKKKYEEAIPKSNLLFKTSCKIFEGNIKKQNEFEIPLYTESPLPPNSSQQEAIKNSYID